MFEQINMIQFKFGKLTTISLGYKDLAVLICC